MLDEYVPSQYEGHWWQRRDLLRLNITILLLIQLSSTNGYDGSLINGLQAIPTFQEFLSSPTGSWLGFIVAIQPLGQIVAYFPCAYVVQHYGRKAGIWCGYIWLVIGTSLLTAAQNAATWIVGRLFMGFTTAFFFGSVPILISEIAYPSQRGICTSCWNTMWFLGGLISAWAIYGTGSTYGDNSWAWRLPCILQLLLPIVALPGVIMTPESPRWLLSNSRHDEAVAVLAKFHAQSDEKSELVAFEVAEIENALKVESQNNSLALYKSMFRGRGNRHRMFITISLGFLAQWNGVGIIQYYLVPVLESVNVTSPKDQTTINGCLQIWNLIFAITGAFLVDRVGRRKLFAASNIVMLISMCFVAGFSAAFTEIDEPGKASGYGIAVIPFLFIFYAAYCCAYNPLQFAYTVEIWQYSYRAAGLAVGLISTAIAILTNSFVNPIALKDIGWKYYFVYIGVLIAATVTCWLFYPETRQRTLEEIAEVFDGEEVGLKIRAHRNQDSTLPIEPAKQA